MLPTLVQVLKRRFRNTKYSQDKKELLMRTIRFVKSLAILAGVMLMFSAPGVARAFSISAGEGQSPTPTPALPGPQPNGAASPAEYFEGLEYTAEQKTQIDKIHQDAEIKRAVVAKDDKLTQDQKDAMLVGYTHLEYGSIFKVLTPDQQRQVRHRIRARKVADQAAQKTQTPQS